MKRITPAIRREAALICAICASADDESVEFGSTGQAMLGADLSLTSQALAYEAWSFVTDEFDALPASTDDYYTRKRICYAEAEALLRTGYVPEGWTT